MARDWPEARHGLTLSIYGEGPRRRPDGRRTGTGEHIAVVPPVAYGDFLKGLGRAYALLFVGATCQGLFAPGKLTDYLGADRPILAFAERGTELARILEGAGDGELLCDPLDAMGGARRPGFALGSMETPRKLAPRQRGRGLLGGGRGGGDVAIPGGYGVKPRSVGERPRREGSRRRPGSPEPARGVPVPHRRTGRRSDDGRT